MICGGDFSSATARILPDAAALITLGADIVAVDMPIGLDDERRPGGRDVDRAARAFLGHRASGLSGTGSRVFPAPSRPMTDLVDLGYHAANAELGPGGRFSRQAFNITAKIRDLDRTIPADGPIWEVHPEISFAEMAGATLPPKKSPDGRARRRDALSEHGFPLDRLASELGAKSRRWASDDLFDACAAAWSAHRIAEGRHGTLPDPPGRDSRGHRMAIHY